MDIKPHYFLKPYVLDAILAWCDANDLTPILTSEYHVLREVPFYLSKNKVLLFNVSANAICDKIISTESLTFNTYIRGLNNSQKISLPISSIKNIKIKETGQIFNLDLNECISYGFVEWPEGIDLTKPDTIHKDIRIISEVRNIKTVLIPQRPNLTLVWSQDDIICKQDKD